MYDFLAGKELVLESWLFGCRWGVVDASTSLAGELVSCWDIGASAGAARAGSGVCADASGASLELDAVEMSLDVVVTGPSFELDAAGMSWDIDAAELDAREQSPATIAVGKRSPPFCDRLTSYPAKRQKSAPESTTKTRQNTQI